MMLKKTSASVFAILIASFVSVIPGIASGQTQANTCPAGQPWLGDRTTLGVTSGDRISSVDDLSNRQGAPAGWSERSRVRTDLHLLVVMEWPGNSAALVVLAPQGNEFCVVTGWGFSFGGLGVELSIADQTNFILAQQANRTDLVILEAVATYNNPAGDTSDPYEHRRIVLAVGQNHSSVIADTQGTRFAPFCRWHWFFEGPRNDQIRLRMIRRRGSRSYRIMPGSFVLRN